MDARLIYLRKGDEEGIVVETEGMTDAEIETQYGMAVADKIDIAGGTVDTWPTDRLMVAEG